jgi:hypothetical protein
LDTSTQGIGDKDGQSHNTLDVLSSPDERFENESDADRSIQEVMRELAKKPASGN